MGELHITIGYTRRVKESFWRSHNIYSIDFLCPDNEDREVAIAIIDPIGQQRMKTIISRSGNEPSRIERLCIRSDEKLFIGTKDACPVRIDYEGKGHFEVVVDNGLYQKIKEELDQRS
ncbi:MAG: hypothetical protein V1740_04675 [Candidatus Woesearchaeota archaeon]